MPTPDHARRTSESNGIPEYSHIQCGGLCPEWEASYLYENTGNALTMSTILIVVI